MNIESILTSDNLRSTQQRELIAEYLHTFLSDTYPELTRDQTLEMTISKLPPQMSVEETCKAIYAFVKKHIYPKQEVTRPHSYHIKGLFDEQALKPSLLEIVVAETISGHCGFSAGGYFMGMDLYDAMNDGLPNPPWVLEAAKAMNKRLRAQVINGLCFKPHWTTYEALLAKYGIDPNPEIIVIAEYLNQHPDVTSDQIFQAVTNRLPIPISKVTVYKILSDLQNVGLIAYTSLLEPEISPVYHRTLSEYGVKPSVLAPAILQYLSDNNVRLTADQLFDVVSHRIVYPPTRGEFDDALQMLVDARIVHQRRDGYGVTYFSNLDAQSLNKNVIILPPEYEESTAVEISSLSKKAQELLAKMTLVDHGIEPKSENVVVARFLLNCHDHPTFNQLFETIKNQLPETSSEESVYETVKLFVKARLVTEVAIRTDPIRYDVNINIHSHFIDLRTGRIKDLDDEITTCYTGLEKYIELDQEITIFGEIFPDRLIGEYLGRSRHLWMGNRVFKYLTPRLPELPSKRAVYKKLKDQLRSRTPEREVTIKHPPAKFVLSSIGLEYTPKRAAVLEYLLSNNSHPTTDQVHEAVTEKFEPSLSKVEVQNILDTIVKSKLFDQVSIDTCCFRYHLNPFKHYHFVDMRTGNILDLEPETAMNLRTGIYRMCDARIIRFGEILEQRLALHPLKIAEFPDLSLQPCSIS
jgi:Fur family peroxide stress response transcriptional regulator